MKNVNIKLTDAEYKALAVEAYDPQEYLQNYASVRAGKAIKKIAAQEIERRMDAGEPIPSNKEKLILSDSVKTAKELEELEES